MLVSRRAVFSLLSATPASLAASSMARAKAHPLDGWHQGTIKWYSRNYDVGFIDIGKDKAEISFNRLSLGDADPKLARSATPVLVHCVCDERGPWASHVRLAF